MADALQILVQTQQDMKDLQKFELTDDDWLRTIMLSMHQEVDELLQELRWKPWALKDARGRRRRVNKELATYEAADIFAFIGSLLAILQEEYDITPLDIMEALANKVPKTAERLKNQRV
jgi:hypothetical protein